MYSNRYYRSNYHQTPVFSSNNTITSSYPHHVPSLLPTTEQLYSSNSLTIHHNSLLQFPDLSGNSSRIANWNGGHIINQPHHNPHERLLHRSVDTCPTHLNVNQKSKWLKTGEKARANQNLRLAKPTFHWPESHYGTPVHIHNRTSLASIQLIVQKIAGTHLYTIDTESDKPTHQNRQSVPALIQIQAIHNEESATVLLLEVQHLPDRNTTLFRAIQQLCQIIFSVNNTIMAWGDIIRELYPFQQFDLFDISHVIHVFNIQQWFTSEWNKKHPHTSECVARHQPTADDTDMEDCLICVVNTDDLDDEFNSCDTNEDYNTCICATDIRPYKSKGATWSLQKAIHYSFNQTLIKSMTLNIWSCGLDRCLNTWHTNQDIVARQNMILYATNDIIAPTNLFFHLYHSISYNSISIEASHLNTIMSTSPSKQKSYLIIADSHGKNLNSIIMHNDYHIITYVVSGIQWINKYNQNLCIYSLIQQDPLAHLINSCTHVLFLVGTNSARNLPATRVINQIKTVLDVLQSKYPHLKHNKTISIIATFPCLKESTFFPSISLLKANISSYNELLQTLSHTRKFSYVDLNVTVDHLSQDKMHVHHLCKDLMLDAIMKRINNLMIQIDNAILKTKNRSQEATTRRKSRHMKLKNKQKTFTIIRKLHSTWSLKHLKYFLKHNEIKYGRLPETYNHKLRIQFNNLLHLKHAENILPTDIFSEINFHTWIREHEQHIFS
ncbi:unnamed protein product [Rotaria magnacalcarata]